MHKKRAGFSLIELVLVVAILGVVSAIAIPRMLGAKDHARNVADADANFRIMSMQLEAVKAETGLYPTTGTYTWKADGTLPSTNPMPSFSIKGTSIMDFSLVIPANRFSYIISATDKHRGVVLKKDQNGATTS